MKRCPIHVRFQNRCNPGAEFDLLKLEDLYESVFLDHSPFQLHIVEFFMIIVVYEGTGSHTIDFTEHELGRGTVLTVRKDQVQKFHRGQGIKGKAILFTDNFLISYLEKLEMQKSMQLFNDLLVQPKVQFDEYKFEDLCAILDRMEHEYTQVNDQYSSSVLRSILQIIIAMIYRKKEKSNVILSRNRHWSSFIKLQNLVEKHAGEYKKVKDYAKMMGLSTKTLNTITRAVVNKSAKQFVDEIRTLLIKRLLINTDLSTKEIAFQAGFVESTNFYKYFKHQTGFTPEQFRSSLR